MTEIAKHKFSNNIQRKMEEKNMSISEVATKIGGSRVMVSQWINCHNMPRLDNLAALAIVLGVELKDLLKDIELDELV